MQHLISELGVLCLYCLGSCTYNSGHIYWLVLSRVYCARDDDEDLDQRSNAGQYSKTDTRIGQAQPSQ